METISTVPAGAARTPKRASGKSSASTNTAIRERIKKAKPGSVFCPSDFAGLGSRASVDKTLSRLTASGELRRIARGLYDRSETLSELPCAEEIIRALAGKSGLRLQPCGAYAAKLLDLSDQMPLKLVFLTESAMRTVRVGGRQIVLKPGTRRNMAVAGRISGLVIQALRHLGRPNVGEPVLRHLHSRLTSDDKAVLLADASLAPAWIADILRRIASEATPAG